MTAENFFGTKRKRTSVNHLPRRSIATPKEMTGGEALARTIQTFGGGPMFGMGGFQLLPFYDAARRLAFSHHLINDERAASLAADGSLSSYFPDLAAMSRYFLTSRALTNRSLKSSGRRTP